jgi:hypothetical protein
MLEGTDNLEKLASMPSEWMGTAFANNADRTNYRKNHLLGDMPESITDFGSFYTARRDAIRSRIAEMVATKEPDTPE